MGLITKSKSLLQTTLGVKNYLFFISVLKFNFLKLDKRESDIFKFIELIPENTDVLDIGANIGVISATIAKSKNVFVHSFEPIPANAKNVSRLTSFLNIKNLALYQTALGSTHGKVEMITPRRDNVLLEGYSHIIDSKSTENVGAHFTVEINMLDNISAISSKTISAIKIDVENYELEVLKGAAKLIAKSHPIIYCELWNNSVRFEVINYLSSFGYKCYVKRNSELKESDGYVGDDLNFFFLYENLGRVHSEKEFLNGTIQT